MGQEQESLGFLLLRYLVHGLLFNMIFFVLSFVWLAIFVSLVILGAIIGLIIGIIVLFLILGAANSFLMGRVWGIPAKSDWKSLLTHGVALFLVLLIVSIPSVVVVFALPRTSLPTRVLVSAVIFTAYCFIDGLVAKSVGNVWEEEIDSSEQ